MKVSGGEGFESAGDGIVGLDGFKSLRNILAVGADVLDGGGGGVAGDAAQGFDAGEVFAASVGDDVVPVFAAHDLNYVEEVLLDIFFGDAAHAVDDDGAREAFVMAERVGAATENESREILKRSEIVSVGNFGGGFDFDYITGGAAEAHGGKTGN